MIDSGAPILPSWPDKLLGVISFRDVPRRCSRAGLREPHAQGYIRTGPNSLEARESPYRTHPSLSSFASSRWPSVHAACRYRHGSAAAARIGPAAPRNLKHTSCLASEEAQRSASRSARRSARYIEARLSGLGYASPQEFEHEGEGSKSGGAAHRPGFGRGASRRDRGPIRFGAGARSGG